MLREVRGRSIMKFKFQINPVTLGVYNGGGNHVYLRTEAIH